MPNSNVSWFIMILPYVGFANQFNDCVDGQIWFGSAGTGSTSHSQISNDVTYCPSRADHYNMANGGVNMHYRANGAGASTAAGSFNRNDGAIGDNANNVFVSLSDVVAGDGAANTLLIAEGKRDRWYPWTWSNPNTPGVTVVGTFTSTGGHNNSPPFLVHPDPGGNLLFGFTPSGTVNATTPIINTQQVLFPTSAEQSFANASEAVHPGGANVAFVDGSWRFLKEDLAPHVYGHLLTHRSVWDGSNYSTNSARANVFLKLVPAPATNPYTLKTEDY
jgi:prepilin-type processing-associated H-X9-DG protein